jgi:hypothetical protein
MSDPVEDQCFQCPPTVAAQLFVKGLEQSLAISETKEPLDIETVKLLRDRLFCDGFGCYAGDGQWRH